MKILILGSQGVVGKALVKYLKSINVAYEEWDIKLSPTHDLRKENNINHLEEAMMRADFVMFLSFDVGGSKYIIGKSVDFINNNLLIMVNTFRALETTKKPFIFASSQMSNMHYCSYGTCKKIGEHYTQILGGMTVQFWNVYGPEEINVKSHVINDFIHMAKVNKKIVMRTDGNENRQFLYDSDCSSALYALARKYDDYKNRIVHLTTGRWTSIYEIANIIAALMLKRGIEITIERGLIKDESQTFENTPTNFIEKQDWEPQISLEEGINKIIDMDINME